MPADKDYSWFTAQLDERLGPLQMDAGGVALDFRDVVQAHGDEFVTELSDAALAQVFEYCAALTDPTWKEFRGKIRAEQAKRAGRESRTIKFIVGWTLAFTVVAVILAALTLWVTVQS